MCPAHAHPTVGSGGPAALLLLVGLVLIMLTALAFVEQAARQELRSERSAIRGVVLDRVLCGPDDLAAGAAAI
jgi:hypothetical protein